MKRKILLALLISTVLVCLFGLTVFAAEPSSSDAFGEISLITDNDAINAKDDYGYSDGDTARVVVKVPETETYLTYPAHYIFDARNDGASGYQPQLNMKYLINATGLAYNEASIIRLEIPEAFTGISSNYTKTTLMTSLKSISIPSTVFILHRGCFGNLSALESVIFEDSLNEEATLTIDYGAFQNCTSLKDVQLPTHLSTLGERAFYNCKTLESIDLRGSKLAAVGTASFGDCLALKTVTIDPNNNITKVNHRAFDNCPSLTGRIVFDKVTVIDSYAFRNCAKNEGCELILEFPVIETLGGTSGDAHVFSYSTGLKEVYLGTKLKATTHNNFTNCIGLEVVKIDAVDPTFTTFPTYMFDGCSALKSFVIPEGITSLSSRMFLNCSSMGPVYLPSTLTAINSGAQDHATFARCTNLYFVNETFDPSDLDNLPSKPDVYYFPSGLATVTGETFKLCQGLNKTLVFPESLTSIENSWAFEAGINNPTLENIVFLGNMEKVSSSGGGSWWKLTGKVYFANESDKSTSNVTIAGLSGKYVFCNADGNTEHLYLVEANTAPTCLLDGVKGYECFCGKASDTAEVVPALGHEENELLAKYFASVNGTLDYYNDMVTEHSCTRCDATVYGTVYGTALFTKKGYSYSQYDSTTFSYTVYVNAEAIKAYNEALLYGIVVSANVSGTPISYADGAISHDDKTIAIEFQNTSVAYSIITAKLTNVGATTELHMSAYCVDNGVVSYLGHDAVNEVAETISHEILLTKYPSGKEE